MSTVLNTQTTPENVEAASGRFFDAPQFRALPEPEEIDLAAEAAVVDIDESLLAFGGMRRSVSTYEKILESVDPRRVHEAAQHIAGVLESALPGGPFKLDRANGYFMGVDAFNRSGNGNWLWLPKDYNHAAFTEPSDPMLLNADVEMADLNDEARLIDDVVTHTQHAKTRRMRQKNEESIKEAEEWRKSQGVDVVPKHEDPPGWLTMEFYTAPKIEQGVLVYETYRNFRTGEVTWGISPQV